MALCFLGFQLLLSGCLGLSGGRDRGSIRYFVLSGREERSPAREESFVPECVICLKRVSLPAYLDRPQLVLQGTGGKVIVSGSLRWGEPLADGIGKMLRNCLERRLPQDLVLVAPWSSATEPYFLLCPTVDDLAIGSQSARIRAHCEFWDRKGNNLLGIKRYDSTAARRGDSAEDAVGAVERLLEEFGDALGEDLRRLRAGELDLFSAGRDRPARTSEEAAAIVRKIQLERPLAAAAVMPKSRPIRHDIVLEVSSANYITIDNLETGGRIFSRKMKAGQTRSVPYEKPVRVSASQPDGLLVNGKSVTEFNRLEASAFQDSAE